MNDWQTNLPEKILEAIERAGIATIKQIILYSISDIEKVTLLRRGDIVLLKNIVSEHTLPRTVTCDLLENTKKISSGCTEIDKLLKGGFRVGTITELYGESGSGKTQIAIQTAAHNWPNYTIYICTEDLFPVKRFNEIKVGVHNHNSSIECGSKVFVEHITEASDLLSCVRVRLPKLLAQNSFTLIIVDSVAAPFRVESTNYIQRAEELRELAVSLISLAQRHNLAILCINQVSAALDGPVDLLPSLGLAWSNIVNTRLYLQKKSQCANVDRENSSHVRELSVTFAPDLPNFSANFTITRDGLQSINGTEF